MTTASNRLRRIVATDWNIFKRTWFNRELPNDCVALAEELLSRRGEASGTILAQQLLDAFESASADNQLTFFKRLASRFDADDNVLQAAVNNYADDKSPRLAYALHKASEPRRQELFRRLNYSPGGTHRLIRMRENLLGHVNGNPELRVVDSDFRHLFKSWFNPGFLQMRPIDWHTPADILEKLIHYEAVHTIHGWSDLRSRLDPVDRYCFGFFHPQLPDEPLIFVEVALASKISSSVQELLSNERIPVPAEEASTAVFYSISNTQRGLANVPFGSFLLKRVIEYLKRVIPSLKTFVTLSPVPGFSRWLAEQRCLGQSGLLSEDMLVELELLDKPNWNEDEEAVKALRDPFLESAAIYFLLARDLRGSLVDPVARFHLRNGAELHELNFLADVSGNGMRQSNGLMVNYLYELDNIERNHEAFVERNEVTASRRVRSRAPMNRKQSNKE